MTSEIAVMNQRAVALAADSAVTLIDGGTVVVRNDQRKLYNLVGGAPIGVMFFGVADMMGHPWEHLIEHYPEEVSKAGALPHVRDYAPVFSGMLDHLEEFFPQDAPERRISSGFWRRCSVYIFHLAQYHARIRRPGSAQASPTPSILEEAIERVWRDYQFREDGYAARRSDLFPARLRRSGSPRLHAAAIDELIAYGFQPFGLGKQALQRLKEIAVFCRGQGPVSRRRHGPGVRRLWFRRAISRSSSPISCRQSSVE